MHASRTKTLPASAFFLKAGLVLSFCLSSGLIGLIGLTSAPAHAEAVSKPIITAPLPKPIPIPVPARSADHSSAKPVAPADSTKAKTPPAPAAPSASVPSMPPASASAGQTARPQAEKILFDKISMQGRKPALSAIWVRAANINPQARKPTVIALHDCGGLYSVIRRDQNLLTPRTAGMARELRNAGYNVLFPDSLTARGKASICTESSQQRDASTSEQARDVQAALRWLAQQDDVDLERIALLGWANGGSAVMKVIGAAPERGVPAVRTAVAFYPECAQFDRPRSVYKPDVPLLLLMGEEDDWSPLAPCTALTEKAKGIPIKLNTYPDAYHGFDSPGTPLHVRLDVPNPAHPGQGVTSGTNPDAKIAAYHDMLDFLAAGLK